jgi:hypothetical protein
METDLAQKGDCLFAAERRGLGRLEFATPTGPAQVLEELLMELRRHSVEIGLCENEFHWCPFSRLVGG